MYHKALRKMKLLLVVLCLAFAYATAEDEHCGNKDAVSPTVDIQRIVPSPSFELLFDLQLNSYIQTF